MGSFRVHIGVGSTVGDRFADIEALVDSGATYTWVPRNVLEQLGVHPSEERAFLLADGRFVNSDRLGTGAG